MKIKSAEIHKVRAEIQTQQNGLCAICAGDFSVLTFNHAKKIKQKKYTACLDHNHDTGAIRGVLCSGCNSVEGKIKLAAFRYHRSIGRDLSLPEYLRSLATYLERHEENLTGLTHPDFYTDEEKHDRRKARARKRYSKSKLKQR